MKTINFIQCSIALATALFISSCSDDDDSAQGGSSSQGITTVEAIIPEPMLWNTDNTIALYAKKADSEKDLFYTEDSQVSEATFEAVKKAFPTPEEGDYIRAFYPAENPSQISRCHDNKHQKIPTSFAQNVPEQDTAVHGHIFHAI